MADFPGGSLTILGIFLMGLSLNLTPCVYPMLSVTISLFGSQKEIHRTRAFVKALVYVLGIASMYSVLGVLAAMTGQIFGALLQNRWVLLGLAFLLVALALSMFEVYTFQMPSWFLKKAGDVDKVHLVGIYLSGLFVGIFAAPCIGPPVIALLTFAGTRGDPLFAFWVFFVMSLGLGLPYLILGTFSHLIQHLPRSGAWLVWVEHAFGIILLALAGMYAILALNPSLLKWWPFISLVAGGLYLGFIDPAGNHVPVFRTLKAILGTAAIVAGIVMPVAGPRPSVLWEVYHPAILEEASQEGKPVIMDFFADWCIPCHELDQFTYSDPKVIEALKPFKKVKVDLTNPDSREVLELTERFEILGVPTILFLDPKGEEVSQARVTGFIPPKMLLAIVDSPQLQEGMETQNQGLTNQSK